MPGSRRDEKGVTMSYKIHTEKSWAATQNELEDTFRLWGVDRWETNFPRGARREGYGQTDDERKVVLTYWKESKRVVLEMGTQERAVDNLRVLYLTVEAMRMNEKRGISEVMASAYLQIAAPAGSRDPYDVLGLPRGLAIAIYETQFKELAKSRHPDTGGTVEDFKELSEAIEKIREDVSK